MQGIVLVRTIRICSLLQKVTTNVRIVELQPDGTEIRPLDLSIPKSVCVLSLMQSFLCVILIPASWCRKHKVTDKGS